MRAMIGTWRMSLGGVARGLGLLEAGADCLDAVTEAVAFVEDDPAFTSVGFGGLPDREGCVTGGRRAHGWRHAAPGRGDERAEHPQPHPRGQTARYF